MPRPGMGFYLMVFLQYTFVGVAFSAIALLTSLFYDGQRAEALRLFSLVTLPIMPSAAIVKIVWILVSGRLKRRT